MHIFEALIDLVGDVLIGIVPSKKNKRDGLTVEPLIKPKFKQSIAQGASEPPKIIIKSIPSIHSESRILKDDRWMYGSWNIIYFRITTSPHKTELTKREWIS